MAVSPTLLSLREWLAATGPIADANIVAIEEGWSVTAEFLELHSLAIEAFSRAAGKDPTPRERALLVLAVHALNLSSAAFGLVARGQFDVAPYVTRSLLDCHSLLFGCGQDESVAERFLAGEEKLAWPSRKVFLDALRSSGYEDDATWIEARFKGDYDAGNVLAHVGASQVGRVIHRDGDTIQPILGGRVDAAEANLLWRAVLDQEHWALIAVRGACADVLDGNWTTRFESAQAGLVAYMKKHEAKDGDGR